MGPGDTQEILERAVAGDRESLSELLEIVRPRLVMWAAAQMGPKLKARYEPEDVAQVILSSVFQGWGGFQAKSPAAFWGWVRKIADHDLKDLVDYEGALKRQLPPPLSFTQTSPSTAATRREDVLVMMEALDGLEPQHREVIVLRDIEQRSVAEVAEILAKSPNAVRIAYCRALKALREHMGLAVSRTRETKAGEFR
jgi:RNA polymerase sigma-70 factor (ECF subfamily)